MKILDKLPVSVKNEIKSKIEAELERYRMWKYIIFQERESSITASWSDTPKGFTGTTSDQTGNIATHNVDEPEHRRKFCERIELAVNRLPSRERQILKDRYMQREPIFDYVVFNQLSDPPLSEGTYYKIKNRAMAMLALSLNLDVKELRELY